MPTDDELAAALRVLREALPEMARGLSALAGAAERLEEAARQLRRGLPEVAPKPMTVQEAARYLQVDAATLYRAVQRGRLVPSFRVGTVYRLTIQDLERAFGRQE